MNRLNGLFTGFWVTTPDVGLLQTELSPIPLFETGWENGPTGHLGVIREKPDGPLG